MADEVKLGDCGLAREVTSQREVRHVHAAVRGEVAGHE
jgi:hypothetical protein